jgi:hypothetical protein
VKSEFWQCLKVGGFKIVCLDEKGDLLCRHLSHAPQKEGSHGDKKKSVQW